MTGTILLLMVGRGIPLLVKTSVMVSWAVLGSLENRRCHSLFNCFHCLKL